jgi:hypothetical protein
MLFGVVALGLGSLVGPGVAQDAKKVGDKDSKGSIPAANKALQIPDDQTKKIQAIDVERMKYMVIKRELISIDSQIRQTVAGLSEARAQLKAIESYEVPAYLIEVLVNGHPWVQNEQSEIAHLRDRIDNYRGRSKRVRQMEQALREANARLRTVKASVQPEVQQQLQKRLSRQLVGHIEEIEKLLTVLKDEHAVILKEMNHLADQWARAGIAASELERQRAEMEKNDVKGSKEKGPGKK